MLSVFGKLDQSSQKKSSNFLLTRIC